MKTSSVVYSAVCSRDREFRTPSATQWHDLCLQNDFRFGWLKFDDYFVLRLDSTTRGHKYKLFTKYSRLNVRKHFFTERVVSVWNNLERDIL